jgi:hypothetical protein
MLHNLGFTPLSPPLERGEIPGFFVPNKATSVLPLTKGELEGVCEICAYTAALGKGALEGGQLTNAQFTQPR